MADDILDDESAEIAVLEKEQRSDKGTIGGEPKQPPQQQAQPEPKAEPVAAKPDSDEPLAEDILDEGNKGKFIRHGAFHAERERRKAIEKQAAEERAQFAQTAAQMQARLMALVQAQQQPQAQQPRQPEAPPQLPDKNTDPVGYLEGLAQQNRTELDQIRQWRAQQEQGQQRNTALSAVKHEVARLEDEFKAATPDYDQAQKHLEQSWIAEAKAAGYADHEMPQVLVARTWELLQAAGRSNTNPAAIAYAVAKQRGYTNQPQAPVNNLDTVARGLAVSKSPTTAQGNAPSATPALDALLQMPDEDFAAAVEGKNWEKIRRQMMGGNSSGASY